MQHRKKRVSSTERLPLAEARREYPIQLTERDTAILKALAWLQSLTTEQIRRLFFPGNWSTCTKRLQRLFQNRYIGRSKVDLRKLGFKEGPQETLLHTLDEAGATVLAQELEKSIETTKISEQGLRHLILNNDVRIAIKLALETLGYTVEHWETDQTLRRKSAEQKWVVDFVPLYGTEGDPETGEIIPDDMLIISTPTSNVISLLELDTGTELRAPRSQPKGKDTSIASKVRKYLALFHKPSKKEPSTFELATGIESQRGVRVFFVTTGGEDAVNKLLTVIRNAGGLNMFWVGRYELAQREDRALTRPIWRKAGDSEPVYYPWIGMSHVEQLRQRLRQSGAGGADIEARVTAIMNLAKAQISEGWSERKLDMSLEQAMALRSDELAEAILKIFTVAMEQKSNGNLNKDD